jgi:sugar/nucleoside kinase (ribokinase family)
MPGTLAHPSLILSLSKEPVEGHPTPDSRGRPEFLVVGHVTRDLVPGGWNLGGPASYAALVAARLGLRAAVLTAANAALDLPALLPGVDVRCLSSQRTTVMEHFFDGERRIQYLREQAPPINSLSVPCELRGVPVVLLGAVCGDLDASLAAAFPDALIGATAQGWLRRVEADGRISEGHTGDLRPRDFAGRLSALFLSDEDLGGAALPESWTASVPILVLTRGHLGAGICLDGTWWRIPAFPARAVDGTGAGDAFAAAFLVHLHETGDAQEAARFAAAAASFVVEAIGTEGAPTRAQVEARLRAHPELRLSRV